MNRKYFLPFILLIVYIVYLILLFRVPASYTDVQAGFNSDMFLDLFPLRLMGIIAVLIYGITIRSFTEFATAELKTNVLIVMLFTIVNGIFLISYSIDPISASRFMFVSSIFSVLIYLILIIQTFHYVRSNENIVLKYLVVFSSLLLLFQTGLVFFILDVFIDPRSIDAILEFNKLYSLISSSTFILIIILRIGTLYKVLDLE